MQAQSGEVPLTMSVLPNPGHEGLSIEQFRALVGIPQEDPPPTLSNQTFNGLIRTQNGYRSMSNLNDHHENLPPLPPPIRVATVTNSGFASQGSRILTGLHLLPRPAAARGKKNKSGRDTNEAAEYATSLYYTLVREESDQIRLCHFYNIVTYFCLLMQLAIASVLIILGAIPGSPGDLDHRIPIAILGAVTGLLTGLMSLLKGQGLPNRLIQYANRLRQVRDKLEFMEHALRANVGAIITLQDVVNVWNEFENVRNEREMNRPDVWTTTTQITPPPMITLAQQPRQNGNPMSAPAATPKPTTAPGSAPAAVGPSIQQHQTTGPAGSQGVQQPSTSHVNTALQNSGSQTVHGETTLANTNPFGSPNRGNSIRISNGTTVA